MLALFETRFVLTNAVGMSKEYPLAGDSLLIPILLLLTSRWSNATEPLEFLKFKCLLI